MSTSAPAATAALPGTAKTVTKGKKRSAPKEPKAPKAPKEPKAPKAPKAPKKPRVPGVKAPKLPGRVVSGYTIFSAEQRALMGDVDFASSNQIIGERWNSLTPEKQEEYKTKFNAHKAAVQAVNPTLKDKFKAAKTHKPLQMYMQHEAAKLVAEGKLEAPVERANKRRKVSGEDGEAQPVAVEVNTKKPKMLPISEELRAKLTKQFIELPLSHREAFFNWSAKAKAKAKAEANVRLAQAMVEAFDTDMTAVKPQ